ncbi:MAG: CBS domain-containing protein [Myxococcales bacterium]|nr:CBS domain-containing protein [Myxococcales bacterium]
MKTTRVEDIMTTNVLTLAEGDSVELGKLTMDVACIRHLPVTDPKGKLIGIVALTDLLRALALSGGAAVSVREVMQTGIRTIHRRAPAREAARTMLDQKIGSLPVLGEGGALEGIVTETDFLRIAEGALQGPEPRYRAEPLDFEGR